MIEVVDSAPVTCGGCGRTFGLEREVIRSLVDAGTEPRCPGCEFVPDAEARPAATNAEVVLLAVAQVCREKVAFAAEQRDVIERAWQLAPARLGIDGMTRYPDSNKVIVLLVEMCREGSARNVSGLLHRPVQRAYALTPKGIALAKRLTPPEADR